MGRGAWQEGLVPPACRPHRAKRLKGFAFLYVKMVPAAQQEDSKGFAFQKVCALPTNRETLLPRFL